jgi:hypothetical protein
MSLATWADAVRRWCDPVFMAAELSCEGWGLWVEIHRLTGESPGSPTKFLDRSASFTG